MNREEHAGYERAAQIEIGGHLDSLAALYDVTRRRREPDSALRIRLLRAIRGRRFRIVTPKPVYLSDVIVIRPNMSGWEACAGPETDGSNILMTRYDLDELVDQLRRVYPREHLVILAKDA